MNSNHPFIERVGKNAGLAIALGALSALLGILAMISPLSAGVAVVSVAGFLLLAGGVALVVFAFKTGAGIWPYVQGVLTILVGGYLASEPGVTAGALTIILFIYLVANGIADVLLSFVIKPESGWVWTLVGGALSVVLGFMIWGQFPFAGAMAIGVILGVRLLLNGITLIVLGSKARGVVSKLENLPGT